VPRKSKWQSLPCGSLADACLPDFTGADHFLPVCRAGLGRLQLN
jgi:hypothetical protein